MSEQWIKVSSQRQSLVVFDGSKPIQQYVIATAKNGLGERLGSEQTPRGWHNVVDKFGEGADEHAVFVARELSGDYFSAELEQAFPQRDWITARILRLAGLEPGRNQGGEVDSYQRYIYIHGTPHVEQLGQPSSKGCIRMKNSDIIEMFANVALNTRVYIE